VNKVQTNLCGKNVNERAPMPNAPFAVWPKAGTMCSLHLCRLHEPTAREQLTYPDQTFPATPNWFTSRPRTCHQSCPLPMKGVMSPARPPAW